MSATAQGARLACDFQGCSKPGTVEVDAWVYCDSHGGAGRPVAVARHAPVPTPPAAKPVVRIDDTTVQAAVPAVTSPLGLLLEQAGDHSVARIRRLAGRIEGQLDDLRALIAEHAAEERRKVAEVEAATKARAEMERLEAALAAAKAKLPGSRRGNRKPRTPAQIAAATATLAKAREAKAAKAAGQ